MVNQAKSWWFLSDVGHIPLAVRQSLQQRYHTGSQHCLFLQKYMSHMWENSLTPTLVVGTVPTFLLTNSLYSSQVKAVAKNSDPCWPHTFPGSCRQALVVCRQAQMVYKGLQMLPRGSSSAWRNRRLRAWHHHHHVGHSKGVWPSAFRCWSRGHQHLWKLFGSFRIMINSYNTLRIQVCPKGITPTFLFFSDGIGTLNPIRSGGVWILRVLKKAPWNIQWEILKRKLLDASIIPSFSKSSTVPETSSNSTWKWMVGILPFGYGPMFRGYVWAWHGNGLSIRMDNHQ